MIKLLFVCHGNICRSTMAEFVMKELVHRAVLEDDFYIESAACRTDEIGSDTHYGTKNILRDKGIPFTPRKARLITNKDYENFDLIIAMDNENLRDLNRKTNGDPLGKVHLLMEYTGENREVADPWYTGNFEETYQDVDSGCRALLKHLTNQK